MTRRGRGTKLLLLAWLPAALASCGGPLLANAPAPHPIVTAAPPASARPADPQPVVLPRDDAPHDRLTEWWYYTGHLRDEAGGHWGFEFVIFRAERGGFPVSWASHLALTDETGGTFHYAQRSEIGPQVNAAATAGGAAGGAAGIASGPGGASPPAGSAAPPATGFSLGIRGLDATDPSTFTKAPWSMTGNDGRDSLAAFASAADAQGDASGGFGLALTLAAAKPAVLHGGDGYIDFGPAGGSYYYSRTAMSAGGTLTVGDRTLAVDGTAWFDHQWGDFIAVGAGGWDWFAINLDDGTDVTLSLIRAADGSYPLVHGTLVDPAGTWRTLAADEFTVAVTDHWTSVATGATYPAGWTITLPRERLEVTLTPTVPRQELNTVSTTGVIYWEGSQRVTATRAGLPLGGQAYVELTGYAGANCPCAPAPPSP